MQRIIVNEPPAGEFEAVSMDFPNWEAKFTRLARQGGLISYYLHTMPAIPQAIKDLLDRRRYRECILNDGIYWNRFLVPGYS